MADTDTDTNTLIPPARVRALVRFDQIAGFVPGEADADLHVGALMNASGQYGGNYEKLHYDPDAECFYRTPIMINRNNYLYRMGVSPLETPLYRDSNPAVEQGRRTFIPIPRGLQDRSGQIKNGVKAFVSTSQLSQLSYDSDYEGPRWSVIKQPSANSTKTGNLAYSQWLHQSKAGVGVSWAIMQQVAPFENQPFWLTVRKSMTLDTSEAGEAEPNPFRSVHDPVSGSFFMIVIGGGVADVHRDTGSNRTGNSYSIVFPIGAPPFIVDNNVWSDKIRKYKVTDISPVNLMAQAVEEAVMGRNTSDGWMLTNDNTEFFISVMVICNRIYIKSSFASRAWVFPDKLTENLNDGRPMYEYKYQADRFGAAGFRIPPIPIQLHGKGFTASINFNPMEFERGTAFVWTPPLQYSVDQALIPYGQVGQVDLDSDDLDDNLIFDLPDGERMFKGYDLSPVNNKTTMQLASDSVIAVANADENDNKQPDKKASEIAEMDLGNGVELKANSEMSTLTWVRRYKIIFPSGKVPKNGNCAYNYATPFFFRIKLKAFTKFTRAEPSGLDISKYIYQLEHSTKQTDYAIIQRNVRLTCHMPKQNDPWYNSDWGPVTGRGYNPADGISWGVLSRTPALIRVWIGAVGQNIKENFPDMAFPTHAQAENCYFTGISFGGDITQSATKDSVTLDCWDFTALLEEMHYIDSPFFDGLQLPYAIAYILERAGFACLYAIEQNPHYVVEFSQAYQYVLPTSNRFLQPLKKFQLGTKLIDAVKDFINIFALTFRCDYQGKFVLGSWPGPDPVAARYEETNVLGDQMGIPGQKVFKTFPENNSEFYNVLLDRKVLSPKIRQWFNVFHVKTMERFTGVIEGVTDGIPSSIRVDGSGTIPDNFIGYMKLYYSEKSALGGAGPTRKYISTLKKTAGRPRTWCTIKIIGRRNLDLLDIIKIDNNYYRIMEIRGTLNSSPNPIWLMDVVGENCGHFRDDVDNSERHYNNSGGNDV